MADTPTPTSSPAVGRRRFLATAAGATAALLVTDRIPGAWAAPGPPPTTPSPSASPPATRPRPGWCSGPAWRRDRSTRTAACRRGPCRRGPCRSTGRSPPAPAWSGGRTGPGGRRTGDRPRRPRRGRRARTRPPLLVPVPRRRPHQPAGPDQDLRRPAGAAGAPRARRGVLPELGERLLHRLPAPGRGGPRRGPASRGLHLRVRLAAGPGSPPRRRRADRPRRLPRPARPLQDRPRPPGRPRPPPVRDRLGRPRGRERLRRPPPGRGRQPRRVPASPRGRLPGPTGSTCRCGGRHAERACRCTGGCASAT
jgi:hypothetical protein